MIEELRDQMSDLRKQLNESNARIGTLEQKLQKQNTKREEAIATSMRVDRSNKEEARY